MVEQKGKASGLVVSGLLLNSSIIDVVVVVKDVTLWTSGKLDDLLLLQLSAMGNCEAMG